MAGYEWRTDHRGRRSFVRIPDAKSTAPVPEPAAAIPTFDSLTKDQLVEVAKAQHIAHSGTKDEIKARLRS